MSEAQKREAARLRDEGNRLRGLLGPTSHEEMREARIRSVYANLAIDDPTVTLEEVRSVLEATLNAEENKHG